MGHRLTIYGSYFVAEKLYIEYRFASGLVLSGFMDPNEATDMIRNNVAPSQAPNENTPLSEGRFSVLLQDQQIVEWKVGNPSEDALVFHRCVLE
jgi:hypothetical protein